MNMYVRIGAPTVAIAVAAGLIAASSTSQDVASGPAAVIEANDVTAVPDHHQLRRAGSDRLKRTSHIKTRKKVYFITIDDGTVKSKAALRFVKKHELPVTVFLTNAAVGGQWKYFRKIASYGGSVENHTMTHKSLPSAGSALRYEICKAQKTYRKKFGAAPTLLRPPYGNGGYLSDPVDVKRRIDAAAASCGISRIAMWNVVIGTGKVEYVRPPLRRGDIVLLHFGPNLAQELKQLRRIGKAQGLVPGSLTHFL